MTTTTDTTNNIDEAIVIRPKDETFNLMAMRSYIKRHGALLAYEEESSLLDRLKGEKPKLKHSCPESERQIENIQEALVSAYGLVREMLLYQTGMAVAAEFAALDQDKAELLPGFPGEDAKTKKDRLVLKTLNSAGFGSSYEELFIKISQSYETLRGLGSQIHCGGKIRGSYICDLNDMLHELKPTWKIATFGKFGGSFSVRNFRSQWQWFVGQVKYKNPEDRLEGNDMLVAPVVLDLKVVSDQDSIRYIQRKLDQFKEGRILGEADSVIYHRLPDDDVRLMM